VRREAEEARANLLLYNEAQKFPVWPVLWNVRGLQPAREKCREMSDWRRAFSWNWSYIQRRNETLKSLSSIGLCQSVYQKTCSAINETLYEMKLILQWRKYGCQCQWYISAYVKIYQWEEEEGYREISIICDSVLSFRHPSCQSEKQRRMKSCEGENEEEEKKACLLLH